MRTCGQFCLLAALVCSAYAAFLALCYRTCAHPRVNRWVPRLGLLTFVLLLVALSLLALALWQRDFSYDYVARYSSRLLPWYYSLAALWVGQAGSLLIWAGILAGLAVLFRLLPAGDNKLRETAFGVVMGYLSFLTAILVFAADPFQPSLSVPREGLGLSPLLQHPSMLIHPPVVLLGYAAWTFPLAIAAAALIHGRLSAAWTQMARPWALAAWMVLGGGLLLGADWAYQELGWGGYWGWDPVENGSLLPWLTGTALIHGLMVWRHRQCLKKTTVSLAFLTFGLCNFATFLTRSGIFSSVHAFSESPLGWTFLALMAFLLLCGIALVIFRRNALAPGRWPKHILARENLVIAASVLILALTATVFVGTLVAPVSKLLLGRTVVVDASFYNQVLMPIGLLLLTLTAAVPLLRWGEGPGLAQYRALAVCLSLAVAAGAVSIWLGARTVTAVAVTGLTTLSLSSFVAGLLLDAFRRNSLVRAGRLLQLLLDQRRTYAGYIVHLGFISLAVGITGSALGHSRYEVTMAEGEVLSWENRQIHYEKLVQRAEPQKLIAEVVLHIHAEGRSAVTLQPARHLDLVQNEWTTEVAIDSNWSGDFYTILHAGLGDGKVSLTFVLNPMIRWMWLGGGVSFLGAVLALWPVRKDRKFVIAEKTSVNDNVDGERRAA